jgi:hypothetical protein
LPKLEPVGVFKLVLPSPVNVIMSALPIPPVNVTEFEPLPPQPTQVKIPDVLNVTGSAFASDVETAATARRKPLSRAVLQKRFMSNLPYSPFTECSIVIQPVRGRFMFKFSCLVAVIRPLDRSTYLKLAREANLRPSWGTAIVCVFVHLLTCVVRRRGLLV